jgi:hypothetical protein
MKTGQNQILIFLMVALTLLSCKETPLQRADKDFDVTVEQPDFRENKPILLFDEGHHNFHTTTGLYEPFANLAKNDGYDLKTLSTPVTTEALNSATLYVIANAKGQGDLNDTPAFTEAETEIITIG